MPTYDIKGTDGKGNSAGNLLMLHILLNRKLNFAVLYPKYNS